MLAIVAGLLGPPAGHGRCDADADDERFMSMAIEEARLGFSQGGIPIAGILVGPGKDGPKTVLGRGHNMRVQNGDPLLHGETAAFKAAGRLSANIYRQSTMYTTLSPCAMCSGTCILYKLARVVIAENETFKGEEELLRSRGVKVDLCYRKEAKELMDKFIAKNPGLWNEDIGEP